MLSWVNLKNVTQFKWAVNYVNKKTGKPISELNNIEELEAAISKDCELMDVEAKEFSRKMRTAWNKQSSRDKRKLDLSPEGKSRRELNINNKTYEKLKLMAKVKKVTMSQVIEELVEREELQLEMEDLK